MFRYFNGKKIERKKRMIDKMLYRILILEGFTERYNQWEETKKEYFEKYEKQAEEVAN